METWRETLTGCHFPPWSTSPSPGLQGGQGGGQGSPQPLGGGAGCCLGLGGKRVGRLGSCWPCSWSLLPEVTGRGCPGWGGGLEGETEEEGDTGRTSSLEADLALVAGEEETLAQTPLCGELGRGCGRQAGHGTGSRAPRPRAGPRRDAPHEASEVSEGTEKPRVRGPFVPLAIEVCRALYRPHSPVHSPWRCPVPARGWEFCRLYRNRHPIFLQLRFC